MDRFFNKKVAMQSARILSFSLLIIHTWFIFYFHALDVVEMRNLNFLSVLIYIISFWIIQKEKIDWFISIVGIEVMVHMIFAAYFVGTDCGLQITLLGMPIVFFYTDYFSLKLRGRSAHGILYSVIYMISYICIEFIDRYHKAVYVLPEWVNFYTKLSILILAFVIPIILAYVMTRYSYSMEKNLRQLAQTDAMTGLLDRYGMQDVVRAAIKGENATECWIAVLELDNYEWIRQTYGHVAADQALIEIANCMQRRMPDCTCARWDSNEFTIGGKNVSESREKLDHLLEKIQQIQVLDMTEECLLQVSGGVAVYEDSMEMQDWLERAEQKLQLARYNGGNQVIM